MTTYDIRLLILCAMCFCFALTKISFFVTQKGPRTHVIVYPSFVKEQIGLESSARILAIER